MDSLPLTGLKVLDFTTMLPGPLATLFLAETGASVVKIEPPSGERARAHVPQSHGESIPFALINRGKKSVVADLKNASELAAVKRLAADADIVVEQFRPTVMMRLGLGYDELRVINPKLIYCSITGYGQTGPSAARAGHDLNYLARSGVLSLGGDREGRAIIPPALLADIGGGTFPAALNILLALQKRQLTGVGCHIDVAITENLFAWMHHALAATSLGQNVPKGGRTRHTGGSPRYNIYQTRDDKALALAALEEKFWSQFCDLIGLSPELRDDATQPDTVRSRIAEIVSRRARAEWEDIFEGKDVCVEFVQDLFDATQDEHFVSRGVFRRTLDLQDGSQIAALPLPISRHLVDDALQRAPGLGSSSLNDADLWERASIGDPAS